MSVTNEETELALYAKLLDPDSLVEADGIEDHIQLESKLISGARIRVRKITPIKGGPTSGADRYELTLKIPADPVGGIPSSMETTQEVDRPFYEEFAKVCHRAIVKRRYSIMGSVPVISGAEDVVIPPVKYEVDRFLNPTTRTYSEWIKIDIELDGVLNALKDAGIPIEGVRQRFDLTRLPFTSGDMFTSAGATPEQKALLGKLWETEFAQKVAPDAYDEKKAEVTPPVQQETVDASKVNTDELAQEKQEGVDTPDSIAAA